MGCELVSSSLPQSGGRENNSAPISYTELFYENLPYYLSIGMTWDEYWNDDCIKAKYYRKADKLKRKQRNQELWLQGMYIYEAIGDMSPVLRFTMDKKPKKPLPYVNEPYPIDQQELEEKRMRKEKERVERMKAKVSAWAIKANASQKQKEVVTDE